MATVMMSSQAMGVKTTPFRAARSSSRFAARQPRMVVAQASKEPVDFVKSAVATLAAASLAFSAPAFATESGIMPSRNRDEDNAARAFMDSKEKKNPAVQSRSSDPNSGNVDTFKVAGVSQADARQPAGRYPKGDPNHVVSLDDQASSLPATRGPGAGSEADSKLDAKAALSKANDRSKAVAFAYDGAALQVNVGVFGRGDVGTQRDQIEQGKDVVKETAANPLQKAGQAASRAQRSANEVLSNPAGEEATKDAAQNLSDANAEIPRALSQGFADLKNQLTNPTAFSPFDAAALQHSAGLKDTWSSSPASLQHNVRVGDLQSITGGQAKKAGVDSTIRASSEGGSDAQLITNESTSGVKARGASGSPGDTGAADRAQSRVDKLTNDKTAVP